MKEREIWQSSMPQETPRKKEPDMQERERVKERFRGLIGILWDLLLQVTVTFSLAESTIFAPSHLWSLEQAIKVRIGYIIVAMISVLKVVKIQTVCRNDYISPVTKSYHIYTWYRLLGSSLADVKTPGRFTWKVILRALYIEHRSLWRAPSSLLLYQPANIPPYFPS